MGRDVVTVGHGVSLSTEEVTGMTGRDVVTVGHGVSPCKEAVTGVTGRDQSRHVLVYLCFKVVFGWWVRSLGGLAVLELFRTWGSQGLKGS